jgi:hypothetical protein
MALKTTIAAALAAVTLGLFAGSAAEAKTRVVIGVGNVGWGAHGCWNGRRHHCGWHNGRRYHNRGYVYLGGHYRGPHNRVVVYTKGGYGSRGGVISCGRAAGIVDRNGFSAVRAKDCRGEVYSFNARKHGKSYRVKVNAYTGRIIGSGRL